MLVGDRLSKRGDINERLEDLRRRDVDDQRVEVAFVAVDLLWIDDQSILDVPLLERKRLLESALRESRLVRVSAYVRQPIDTWLNSWRMFGFRRLSFRGANSRYVPGAKNPEWSQADIPRR
jgi:ATP-dependent DNA ligase